jgi:hypothetical protein
MQNIATDEIFNNGHEPIKGNIGKASARTLRQAHFYTEGRLPSEPAGLSNYE